jgi:hypothetical protein
VARTNPQENAEKLRIRIAQLQAKLRRQEAAAKTRDRKADTRRKVIAGALALNHLEKNPNDPFGRKMAALLDEYVTKPNERLLFGLPPVEKHGGGDDGANENQGAKLKAAFPR